MEGGEAGGRGRGGGFWCSPNRLEEAKLQRRTMGLIYEFTQRDPPPTMARLGGD